MQKVPSSKLKYYIISYMKVKENSNYGHSSLILYRNSGSFSLVWPVALIEWKNTFAVIRSSGFVVFLSTYIITKKSLHINSLNIQCT
jgi:hypothetical protein